MFDARPRSDGGLQTIPFVCQRLARQVTGIRRAFVVGVIAAWSALSGCAAGGTLTPPPIDLPPISTATPQPIPTVFLTPTPAPFIPTALRLTEPGCCVQPFWSADSRTIQFFDKPESTGILGIYGVSVNRGAARLVSEQVGIPSPDGKYLAFRNDIGQTIVRDISSGDDSVIDNGGLPVYFSPHSQRLAWAEAAQISALVTRLTIHVASIDGSAASQLITVFNGGISGWLDDDRLLIAGRKEAEATDVTLFSVDVNTNEQVNIASEQRMRSVRVAPGGEWILYAVTLDPDNAANDGLWIVSADGAQRYKLAVVGGAQWRDASHLLVIPLEPNAPSHRLWQFDAQTGQAGAITDPAVTSFRVAGGEWAVSPDGKNIVFLNEVDQALWLMPLPPLVS